MAEKTIKVSRYRGGDYTVNYDNNGRLMKYIWSGSKGNKIDTKLLPEYVVDWLIVSTSAIKNGSLVIEDDENSKEITDNINYKEEIKNSIHTRAEIEKILKGNTNTMKSRLDKITNETEKNFVVDVAQDMKIDSMAKREFLAEWADVNINMLFEDMD